MLLLATAGAQTPGTLSLGQAKAYALAHNPRIQSAGSSARAAEAVVREVRSARLPALSGNITGAEAMHNTILAAGAVQTSSLYTRFASGVAVNQLITDFGRTSDLTRSADLRARAQNMTIETIREAVLLDVEQAYFQALGAQAVQRAAQAAVHSRETTLRQVRALAESAMRSTLDVRFAEVALSQAQLDLYQAENNATEGLANLSAALGYDRAQAFTLNEEPMPGALEADPESRIEEALQKRPELAAMGLSRDAARLYAEAEGRLKLPSVTLAGVAGTIPAGDPRLPLDYSAAAVNVNIPIFNGGLFAARRSEAEEKAAAAAADVRNLAIQISREVNVAWLEANTAFRRLDVTARLVTEAGEALRLAQTRYDAGLGSIVELTQAQAAQTSAEIQSAGARYDYLGRRGALDFAAGVLQ
ncbi:MAG TPA: TolC family protein [Bryobacteraceae bacterium]|jgi:outer membrane protein|nr:TolC family protein [Bryobacteraceae bacterium]